MMEIDNYFSVKCKDSLKKKFILYKLKLLLKNNNSNNIFERLEKSSEAIKSIFDIELELKKELFKYDSCSYKGIIEIDKGLAFYSLYGLILGIIDGKLENHEYLIDTFGLSTVDNEEHELILKCKQDREKFIEILQNKCFYTDDKIDLIINKKPSYKKFNKLFKEQSGFYQFKTYKAFIDNYTFAFNIWENIDYEKFNNFYSTLLKKLVLHNEKNTLVFDDYKSNNKQKGRCLSIK